MKYQNYIFDLYGTLVDIRTDEESSMLWEWMAIELQEKYSHSCCVPRMFQLHKTKSPNGSMKVPLGVLFY